jgi:HlyD family secretion protein
MSPRSIAVVLVVLGVVAGVITFARGRSEDAPEVRVAVVASRGVTSRVLAQGKVRAKTQVEVSSEVGGRVAQVNVEVGDVVEVGAPLFALDGEQLRNAADQLGAAISAAEAVLLRTEIAVREAERGVARDKQLLDKAVLSDDAFKLSESRLASALAEQKSAVANVERTRIDLSRAKDALRRAKVTSPLAGTVVAVGVEVGRVVSSGSGLSASPDASLGLGFGGVSAPVIIADLSTLLVKLDVDELDISRVHAGQTAIVRAQGIKDLEFIGVVEKVGLMGKEAMGAVLFSVEVRIDSARPARSLRAVVDAVGNVGGGVGVDGSGGSVEGKAAPVLPAPQEVLRPGMSASAEIEVEHIDDALVVPLSSVLEAEKNDDGEELSDRVIVVVGDVGAEDATLTCAMRPVRLGPSEGEAIAILAGLSAGEHVVEGPYRVLKDLEDDDKVRVEKAKGKDKDGKDKDDKDKTP